MLPSYPASTMRDFAKNVLKNTLRVKRGENLLIETWSATLPWAEAVVLESRVIGARPLLLLEDEETLWRSVEEAPPSNLGHVGSHEWAAFKETDAILYFMGPSDPARWEALPRPVQDRLDAVDHEWFRLLSKYKIRAARWDLGQTNEATARRFGVPLEQWRRELIEAASVDPHALQEEGTKVARAFRAGREVRITHENGTDLTLRLRGRAPKVDDGVIDDADLKSGNGFTFIPSGVTGVAVDEAFAEGTIVGNLPGLAHAEGHPTILTRGARWTFQGGRLTRYSFEKGGEEFRKAFESERPGKERPGIVSVGLNPHTTAIPLLFDQERGVVTVSVGRNVHHEGATKGTRLTAYLSVRGATLTVDGREVVSGGSIR